MIDEQEKNTQELDNQENITPIDNQTEEKDNQELDNANAETADDNNQTEEKDNQELDDTNAETAADNNQNNDEENKAIYKKFLRRLLSFVIYLLIYLVIRAINSKNKFNSIRFEYSSINFDLIMNLILVITGLLLIAYLAYLLSNKFKEKIDKINLKTKEFVYQVIDYISIIPICVNIVLFCISFFFTFATVEGSSMYPTYNENSNREDIVLVNYHKEITTGEVVVAYINPVDNLWSSEEYVIKRVIGMAGDTVTWNNGVLKINGEVVEEDYLPSDTIEHNSSSKKDFDGKFFYYENNQKVESYTVPSGYYFVMGDNRDGSSDSRFFGLVPEDNILGVVTFSIPGVFSAK